MSGVFSDRGVFNPSAGVFSPGGVFSLGGVFDAPSTPPDPLAGIPFPLRLQTHRGDGVPLGLYQDTACTIPATDDGHSVAAWRDELSDSGVVAVQSVSTKRPTLRFAVGKPVLQFDGVDDFLLIDPVPTIGTPISVCSTYRMPLTSPDDSRVVSLASDTGKDWEGTTGIAPVLYDADWVPPSTLVRYGGTYLPMPLADVWKTDLMMADGSDITRWIDGAGEMTTAVDTSALAATRVMIGAAISWGLGDNPMTGYVSSVLIGPWSESQAFAVSDYAQTLRPS